MQKQERLQGSLHFLGVPQSAKHTVFCEDGTAVEHFDPAEHFGTSAELVTRAYNRPRHEQLESETLLQQSSSNKRVGRCDATVNDVM